MKKIFPLGFIASLLAACTGSPADWSRAKTVQHELGGVAHVTLPEGMKGMPEDEKLTGDYATYGWEKVNDTHINGQTSYAENLNIMLFAPDYPRDRFDSDIAEGKLPRFGKKSGPGESGEKGLRWLVQEVTYEQHPVTEPSWLIRVDNRERGIVVSWRGFKKTYTLEQAKQNLTALFDRIVVTGNLASDFQSRRSWPAEGWQQPFETNLRVAKAVFAEKGLSLSPTDSMMREGKWRFFVDDERPQQLHIIHELPSVTLPDGPFRITEKVTYFKYMQARWVQDNQGKESGLLPVSGQRAMAPDFKEQERVYFYQIKAVDLWKAYASESEFAELLRALLRKMESEHTRLVRAGFIAGDAEP